MMINEYLQTAIENLKKAHAQDAPQVDAILKAKHESKWSGQCKNGDYWTLIKHGEESYSTMIGNQQAVEKEERDENHLKRKRLLEAGHAILNGPLALFSAEDDFDWYGKDISITLDIVEGNVLMGRESISIWSDDTMNKTESFFPPIIRYCKWIRSEDLKKLSKKEIEWPSAEVALATIKDTEKLDQQLIGFQEKFKKLPYLSQGLNFAREVPEFEPTGDSRNYCIFLRNGLQVIEFSSCPLLRDGFSEDVFQLFDCIKNHMEPFDKKGWSEQYDFSFETLSKANHYNWHYSFEM